MARSPLRGRLQWPGRHCGVWQPGPRTIGAPWDGSGVLTVATVTDRSGRYYAAGMASEPGVAAERGTGRWLAGGALHLGLTGPVGSEDLAAVLAGKDPRRGRNLTMASGTVAGYDLVFSAPKSVSACYALGDDDTRHAILRAQDDAVDSAMGYVGRHALAVRRATGGERHPEPVEGPVAAAFDHVASRSLDPHLHTHVLVANVGHGTDGRWSALDGRGVFRHARAAGALYEAALRHELGRVLGVGWQYRSDGGIELAGVPPELRGAFSGRNAEIRAHAFDRGSHAAAARRVAWAATRDPKATGVSAEDLDRLWRQRAAAVGIDAARTREPPGAHRALPGVLDERRFEALVLAAGPGVTRRDVVAAWAGTARDGQQVDAVDSAVELWVPTMGLGASEPRIAPSAALAPQQAVAALGPRPSGALGQDRWRAAAAEIGHYAARYAADGRPALVGSMAPADLARMPTSQLAQYLSVRRTVAHVRQELGRAHRPPMERRSLALGR